MRESLLNFVPGVVVWRQAGVVVMIGEMEEGKDAGAKRVEEAVDEEEGGGCDEGEEEDPGATTTKEGGEEVRAVAVVGGRQGGKGEGCGHGGAILSGAQLPPPYIHLPQW